MRIPPIAAPTPMPALAPDDRPVFVMATEVGDEVEAVVGVWVLEGEPLVEVGDEGSAAKSGYTSTILL